MALRDFTDEYGRSWQVWSTYPSTRGQEENVRPTFADGWLTFTFGRQRRRLYPIPDDWEGASEERLRELLHASQDAPLMQRLP